jgi:inorganic triphosphatase YgiF
MGKGKASSGGNGQWPVEQELKLAGAPDALEAAFQAPLLDGAESAEPETRLENVYYDTADHRLRRRGLAFRVRRRGDHYRQTLKADDAAGGVLQARGEWETGLDGPEPDPEALPAKAAKLAEFRKADALQPVFETRVRRRRREVVVVRPEGESRIEAVLNLGEIDTDDGRQPIAEIELELLEGSPADLYQLALELAELAPMQLETQSKSSRGYALSTGDAPAWHRAKKLKLDPEATVDEAMAGIFADCFRHWTVNQAAAADGRDPEGIHQMRVGLRRLRSALSIFKSVIPASQLAWLQPEAKAAIGGLGAARDWDVFILELLGPVKATNPDEVALDVLARLAKKKRNAAYRAARKAIAGPDYAAFVLRYGAWLTGRDWTMDRDITAAARGAGTVAEFATRHLEKRFKRAADMGKNAAELSDADRHQLRIRLKKLRYGVEFFTSIYGRKTVAPFLGALKALQDDLGHLQDLAVARTLLDQLLERPGKADPAVCQRAAGMVLGWHARAATDLVPKAAADWAKLAGTRPYWRDHG